MSNEIAVKGMAPVADFWGDMGQEDFAIPSVTIGQPTSSKGTMGQYNYNNGLAVPFLNGVSLLVPSKTRRMFAGKGKPTRCGSSNFHNPDERYQNPPSKSCMNCPMAVWDENPAKIAMAKELGITHSLEKPLCDQTYTLLMVDGEGVPFFIDFRSSSLKIIQEKLFSRLRLEFVGVAPFAVQFDMSLLRLDAKKGVYYESVFGNFRVGSQERAEKLGSLYQQYSKRAANLREDQISKMD